MSRGETGPGHEDRVIAVAWLSEVLEKPDEVNDGLNHLVRTDPQRALRIVVAITDLTDDIAILAFLGAGPVEDLLVYHPARLGEILLEARRLPAFRTAFRCVWCGRMTPEVRARVEETQALYGGVL